MIDFRLLMEVQEQRGDWRIFKSIDLGNYKLSIQASKNAYCSPKKTIDISDYDDFEIALFDKDWNWMNPKTNSQFDDFKRISELRERWDSNSSDTSVGAYVERDLIQDFCDYLEEKSTANDDLHTLSVNLETGEVTQSGKDNQLDVSYDLQNRMLNVSSLKETKLTNSEKLSLLDDYIDMALQTKDEEWFIKLTDEKNELLSKTLSNMSWDSMED
ncbi:IDEAL domain-containing protein [Priestia megaterium]